MMVFHHSGSEYCGFLDLVPANGQIPASSFLPSTSIDWLSLSPLTFLSTA
jgi:hypothetical protein